MSDATTTVDQDELATDAQFQDTLERVSFQPGILLGSEALNAEQAYHLRRLTRHQCWLIGPGTVFGLRVDTTLPLSALAWASGTVTATTAALHGFAIGGTAQVTIVGATPAVYNAPSRARSRQRRNSPIRSPPILGPQRNQGPMPTQPTSG
jgi:hypothetical protein